MSKTSIVASITTITLTGSLLLLKEKSNSAMRESPITAASHNDNITRIIFNANNIKQLKDEGYIIFDNVLTSKEIEDSSNHVLLMLSN